MKERCQIVVNAKAFAEEKGLDSNEVNCSIEDTCDGLTCQFVPEEKRY